jgi:hypothetical protein
MLARRVLGSFMRSNGLIAGINWAIAAAAVLGSGLVISQIFAPIPPAIINVAESGYKVEQLKSAKEILPYKGMDASAIPKQSISVSTTGIEGQQRSFPTAQQARTESAAPNSATGYNQNMENQPRQSAPSRQPPVSIAPATSSPPPSPGSENLPPYMRYF